MKIARHDRLAERADAARAIRILRVLGSIVGTIVTYFALTATSNNCAVQLLGFVSLFALVPAVTIVMRNAPLTRKVNRVQLLLLVLFPVAAAIVGHALPVAPCVANL